MPLDKSEGIVKAQNSRAVFFHRFALQSGGEPKLYGRGDLHFITFSCYRRRPFLGTPRARHRFVKILDQVRTRYRLLLIGS